MTQPTTGPSRPAVAVFNYNPQFDGLRCIAVILVASYHWVPLVSKSTHGHFLGGLVNFFFVLSSFLITRILFRAREKSSQLNVPWYQFMGVFLIRRTIRIFPAYYLFLLLVLVIPGIGQPVKDHPGMYFSYLANFQMYYSGDFPSVAAHIWTLAVEEQFYLIWPLLIFLVPRKMLPSVILFLIAAAITCRVAGYDERAGSLQVVLTLYNVDAFALGALLAWKTTTDEHTAGIISRIMNLLVVAGVPVAVAIIVFRSEYWSFVANRFLFSVFAFKLIEGAAKGYQNGLGRFLENRRVVYLGKISYGIYLYHLFVPVVFWRLYRLIKHLGMDHFPEFYLRNRRYISKMEKLLVSPGGSYLLYAVLTLLVARLSWKYLELPLSRFKVNYASATSAPVSNKVAA